MALLFGRFVTGLVVLSWLAMTAQACVFVGRYGHNLPRQDEWEFVPVLTGHADSVRWVVSKHAEHRFPLARAVYLGLHAGSGRDFRAGMWVTVALLSASAALLLLAARKSRGRSDLIDLLVPVLLLNAGHAENFTMGYQIAFTLTVGLLAAFAGVAVWADRIGPRRAAGLCGLATLGVALGGGIGWAFVPGLGLFTASVVVAACRQSRHRVRDAVVLASLPALAALYVAASLVELKRAGGTTPGNDLPTALGVAFDFWTAALGGAGRVGYPLPGVVALGCVVEALLATVAAFGTRSADRVRLGGCAAVLVGTVVLSLAIGATRSLGDESRYAAFGGLALCVVVLVRATPGPPAAFWSPGVLLVPAFAAAVVWQDWQVGKSFAEVYEVRTAMLNRDVRLGLPANALAERHVIFPVTGYADAFEMLHVSGHKSLRGAGPSRTLRAVPIPLPPDARLPAYDGVGPAPVFELCLPVPIKMDALRLEIDCPDSRYREVYRLELSTNPDASAGVTSLWLVPGRRTMLFRVEQSLDRVVVRPVERTAGLKLLKCEAVLFE